MNNRTNTTLVIRSGLVLSLALASSSPVRSQSADPPERKVVMEEAPMASMQPGGTSQGARQAGSMTEMMGAPGLVPFDIMTGQAGKWMVGRTHRHDDANAHGDGHVCPDR